MDWRTEAATACLYKYKAYVSTAYKYTQVPKDKCICKQYIELIMTASQRFETDD